MDQNGILTLKNLTFSKVSKPLGKLKKDPSCIWIEPLKLVTRILMISAGS